jgi:hypothetical protein
VVRERYAFGLTMAQRNEVPPGAYIQLWRGDEPGIVVIDLAGAAPALRVGACYAQRQSADVRNA